MTLSRIKQVGYLLLFTAALFAFGCHKKAASAPPPAPAPAPAPTTPSPTVTLRAEPSTIDRGGSVNLLWEAKNASTVRIAPELGDVSPTGNRSVSPTSSVTFTATATGPGGTASDTARITVNVPVAPPVETKAKPDVKVDVLADFTKNVRDIFFDYDKADIRPQDVSVLQSNAAWLKANTGVRFTIEGHCDERGSEEYNVGLGDRRANTVKEFLLSQGIPANRINVVSYGEERPICREQSEECFARNRRAHFALVQ